MKRILLCWIACLSILFVEGQKLKVSEVPLAVKQSFSKSFPKSKEVKWSKENSEEFEAEFKNEGKEMSANFSITGILRSTEMEIRKGDLPKAVQAAISKEFGGYKIKEVERSETHGKGEVFETELEKGSFMWEVQFDMNGTILAKKEKHKS
jgi:hypothetical protein